MPHIALAVALAVTVVVPPEPPQVSVSASCSTNDPTGDGTAAITIVNPPDNGDDTTYSWTVTGPTAGTGAISVPDGSAATVTRSGLLSGSYTVDVIDALTPALTASAAFTVGFCPPPPTTTTTTTTTTTVPGPTTTAVSVTTTLSPRATTLPAAPTIPSTPATLPATR